MNQKSESYREDLHMSKPCTRPRVLKGNFDHAMPLKIYQKIYHGPFFFSELEQRTLESQSEHVPLGTSYLSFISVAMAAYMC
jgi:hypothetical protein